LRLQKHFALHKGFTSKATDWQIVHTETFPSKALAMQREKQLKSWKSIIRIEELISLMPIEPNFKPIFGYLWVFFWIKIIIWVYLGNYMGI